MSHFSKNMQTFLFIEIKILSINWFIYIGKKLFIIKI